MRYEAVVTGMALLMGIALTPLYAQVPTRQDTVAVTRAALEYVLGNRVKLRAGEPVFLANRTSRPYFRTWPDGRVAPDSVTPVAWSDSVREQAVTGLAVLTTAIPNGAPPAQGIHSIGLSWPVISGDSAIIAVTTGYTPAGAKRGRFQSEAFILHRQAGRWIVVRTNVFGMS